MRDILENDKEVQRVTVISPSSNGRFGPSIYVRGIYQILCKETGEFYIGSSVDVPGRWRKHRQLLEGGKHKSPQLQEAWDTYGASSFKFSVLYRLAQNEGMKDLLAQEQKYIDALKPVYNVCQVAGSTEGFTHSEESREKMRVTKARKRAERDGLPNPGDLIDALNWG